MTHCTCNIYIQTHSQNTLGPVTRGARYLQTELVADNRHVACSNIQPQELTSVNVHTVYYACYYIEEYTT